MGLTRITSDGITDGTVVNADINASAAIAGTKISTNFGSQLIQTTGSIVGNGIQSTANLSLDSDVPTINFNDSNSENDFELKNNNGTFTLRDKDAASDRLTVTSAGQFTFATNVDFSSGIDVTGAITGTVSSANTTMLNLKANMGTNNNRPLLIKAPATDSASEPFIISTANSIQFDIDNEKTLFIDSSGQVNLHHDGSAVKLHTTTTGISVGGNIAVTGTVDGRDLTSDGAFADSLYGGSNGTIKSTVVLNNGVTATTQSAGDNSTKVATTAYTDTAISNLVDSSPSALNTLNELAAALGDDANFSTTVTNSIATKLANIVEDTSPELGGDLDTNSNDIKFADNDKALFGAGSDLRIYHDGSNSYITDLGTGDLNINGDDINILTNNNGEYAARFIENGTVILYNDGTEKFRTTSAGVSVTGSLNMGTELNMTEGVAATRSIDAFVGDAGTFRIRGTNSGDSSGHQVLAEFRRNAGVHLNHSGSTKFETTSTGVTVTGSITVTNDIVLQDNLVMGDTDKIQLGDSVDLQIYHDGSDSVIKDAGTGRLSIQTSHLQVANAANSETILNAFEDGAVELYWNNDKKFETYQYGIRTTQNIDIGTHAYLDDNGEVNLGDSQDFVIFHDGSTNVLNGKFHPIELRHQSEVHIKCVDDGAVELYNDNALKLQTTSTGASIDNTCRIENVNNKVSSMVNAKQNIEFKVHQTNGQSALQAAVKSNGVSGWGGQLEFYTKNADGNPSGSLIGYLTLNPNGHLIPTFNGTQDLGGTSNRWRNLYTSDLNLSNEGSSNDVDGTWGSYTIQEGEESLFLINKRNGKKYKFNLTEVS